MTVHHLAKATTKAAAFLLAICALLSPEPLTAGTARDNLVHAIFVEWLVANCDQSSMPAATVAVAQMVLNGSDPVEVQSIRDDFREKAKGSGQSKAEICDAAFKSLKKK